MLKQSFQGNGQPCFETWFLTLSVMALKTKQKHSLVITSLIFRCSRLFEVCCFKHRYRIQCGGLMEDKCLYIHAVQEIKSWVDQSWKLAISFLWPHHFLLKLTPNMHIFHLPIFQRLKSGVCFLVNIRPMYCLNTETVIVSNFFKTWVHWVPYLILNCWSSRTVNILHTIFAFQFMAHEVWTFIFALTLHLFLAEVSGEPFFSPTCSTATLLSGSNK